VFLVETGETLSLPYTMPECLRATGLEAREKPVGEQQDRTPPPSRWSMQRS
jgi:hypothetical protein